MTPHPPLGSTLALSISVTALVILSGCAAPPQLSLGWNGKALLTTLTADKAGAIVIVDPRSQKDREGSTSQGLIWLGDGALSPTPAEAVARELGFLVGEERFEVNALLSQPTSLESFEVAVQWHDLRGQGYTGSPPGVVMFDQLVRTVIQAGKQITFAITVRLSIETGGKAYKAEASGLHSSEAGPVQVQPVLRKALRQLLERIQAAVKSP